MSQTPSSPSSTVVDASFHSMEEVTEVARAAGWRGDYRQLGKGPVTSRWRSLHLGRATLISHRVDNRIHVRIAPPQGCVALVIAPRSSTMLVEGAEFGPDQVLVMNADIDFVTPGETDSLTLVLPRPVLEASGRALFPGMSTKGELTRVMKIPSSGWSALQGDFENLLGKDSISPEELAVILSRFLDLMAGETDEPPRETCHGNRSTRRVAKLAEDYIGDHLGDTIRLEDLCRHTGVSLRTLQRSFRDYFQLSPTDYIRLRRLNATRQALVTGDPSHGSVTRIALDSGFNHLGRFSVDYREHFGESPKETLRRRGGVDESTD